MKILMLILTAMALSVPALARGDKSGMKKTDADQTGTMTTGNQAAGETSGDDMGSEVLNENHITKIMDVVNEGEIDAAKVAEKKSKNERVKAFAEKMKSEHKENKKEGKRVAKKANLDKDKHAMVDMIKENNKMTVKRLKDASDAEFDRMYIQSQVDMHQTVLNHLNTKLLPATQKPELRAHLEKTKTAVEGHLKEAQSIQKTL